ncbi:PrsW family glutamic-type intramembrane protease [Streptomyces sp. UH6]|uniref:PrsW family intramembrane metalloprotease n=1 Tax=Streptomyces sp. UH6 TaxID=2748379 RepID=UPI0015D4BB9E|nr:PrsW family glutamic-type intramembrane protease [Streptomyces sp. UH6]NYV73685.1 PrsW family intramembrane metalloprotease [Streptomyces sp. UH6]
MLLILLMMHVAVGIQMLIDLNRPELTLLNDGAFSVLDGQVHAGPLGRLMVFGFPACWSLAALLGLVALVALAASGPSGRFIRNCKVALAVLLLLPFAAVAVAVTNIFVSPGLSTLALLGCLPSTVLGVLAVHGAQRYRRMPLWLPLAAFGGGLVMGGGFGATTGIWLASHLPNYLWTPGVGAAQLDYTVQTAVYVGAGVFEELGKGAAIAVLFLLFRRHFDGVVSGVVIGAATGLGFNYMESVLYITAGDGVYANLQYWLRQSLGLMAAHTAFTAAIGAGFGIARQLRTPSARRAVIACGFLAAISTHAANNLLLRYFQHEVSDWFPHVSDAVWVLAVFPIAILLLQGPLLVLYLLLLRRGLRGQAAGLAVELVAEAARGHGAVTWGELPALLNPARRFRVKVDVLRRGGGVRAYRRLARLHAAQLELGMHRWHASRDEVDPYDTRDEARLRERVLRLKTDGAVPLLGPQEGVPS